MRKIEYSKKSISKIKIGVDARPFSTPVSGVGKMIHSALLDLGNDSSFEFYLFSHRDLHPSYSNLLNLPGIRFIKGEGFFSKKGGLYFAIALPLQLRKIKLDLFWGTQQVLPPFLSKKTATVLTYNDLVAYRFPDTMRTLARIQQKFYLSRSIKRADKLLPISESTRNEVAKFFHIPLEKMQVVYPGIELSEFKSLLKKKPGERVDLLPKKFFLSVSTIEPRKNYRFLYNSYIEYSKNIKYNQRFSWVIGGKAGWEDPAFIETLRSSESKAAGIIWIESPTNVELAHMYKKCSLFLFSSLYEGFGIPLLEALSLEKPAIVTDLSVFREIGGNKIRYLELEENLWTSALLDFSKKPYSGKKVDIRKFYRSAAAKTISGQIREVLSLKKDLS
ncbi:glycosyltransferase family 4 protein [Leptospira noguchii]|uniref:Glycosyltransferase, group 1 family protein n=1 Tax=Leptospira noguchii serovar Autumnalis str. ZUN142 TaxID=1085540 RepID=M6UFN2_9LEPT|nr:glycosyltransferase family 1 protein [Leptospira noguchii]EKR72624.1 glycosyltransferase, group 1 family protein [Leptospira noguchii str. 2006001870]EMO41626.1 glycosyltransferase, group 1 family protein [Leptospira noguchii serovar Autumnalis str. ZUN142]EMS87659.1 glycosyltransferase, group 1 family protein [Leptospira noguchii str. Hook]UOG29035.1 glycosyltransferase family 4 protein [Leptospira noguchii]UOG36459.1 glycosyltransferase family 4 protein [Leptospira noguchii]